MNKSLYFAAVVITILSSVALIFFALSPIVDSCVPPPDDGAGIIRAAVVRCTIQEVIDWKGVGISLATLTAGIALATYSLIAQKKRK
jgi:hypothetical protein